MCEEAKVRTLATEELNPPTRAAIIDVCIAAHNEPDFRNLFSYIPSGGRHFLAYRGDELVSHAVVTTRWLRTEGLPRLKTSSVDAVAAHCAGWIIPSRWNTLRALRVLRHFSVETQ